MNDTKNINSQCKIVVYQWVDTDPSDTDTETQLSQSNALDISTRVQSFEATKSMSNASGNFKFTLANNTGRSETDWKQIIKRGTWCAVYLSQDGDLMINPDVDTPFKTDVKKLRHLCFVESVRSSSELNEKGAYDITYTVSGKDFGIVYDGTEVWHNVFRTEDSVAVINATSGQLDVTSKVQLNDVLTLIHNLFYNPSVIPGAKVNNRGSISATARQWLMPNDLLRSLGVSQFSGQAPFWGSIEGTLNFAESPMGLSTQNPVDYLDGNAWSALKEISIPSFHELFTEISDDGLPQLIFRPIPWGKNQLNYPTISKFITKYLDVPVVDVGALDVLTVDVGEDTHHIYNCFLVTVENSVIGNTDNVSILQGSRFPYYNDASIKRFGLKKMFVKVNSLINNAMLLNGIPDTKLLIEYNELLVDYWERMEFAETGTVNKIGSNDVKLGKCLRFAEDVPYASNRRYYIESYTDTFEVEGGGAGFWTQTVGLTHGFDESILRGNTGFGTRPNKFINQGEFTKASGND